MIDEWLRPKIKIRAKTIHERLVADPYHFPGSYQRVKEYVRVRRPQIEAELGIKGEVPMHRRFETIAGAQAQVDWGDEGTITTPSGEQGARRRPRFSRIVALRIAPDQTRDTKLSLVPHVLADLGGATREILTDGDTVFAIGETSERRAIFAPEWVDLALTLGSTPRACRPYRAQTKGKVERILW